MNYFQLVLKQMRQRALSTWLTTLSVMLGVALAIAIMVMGRESQSLFGQSDYGYDAIIGKGGSPLQLVLNTIYHIDQSPGNIPYSQYTRLLNPHLPANAVPEDNYYKYVKLAQPFVVGDTLNGIYRIVGTLNSYFGFDDQGNPLPPDHVMDYRPGEKLQIAQGRVFGANKFEAVVGSDIPGLTGQGIGTKLRATHTAATAAQSAEIHQQEWTVVGVLAPTHTSIDRVVYIPLIGFYTIPAHAAGLRAHAQLRAGERPDMTGLLVEPQQAPTPDADGIQHFPDYDFDTHSGQIVKYPSIDQWEISGILVECRGAASEAQLAYALQNSGSDAMCVNPASVMRQFFDTFLKPTRKLLLIICSLVTIVAAVGILVSIYNSVSARIKEIAILRALGATRNTVLTLICLEAGLVALFGAILGALLGHLITGLGAWYMLHTYGEMLDYNWMELVYEGLYVLGVIVLAIFAGLVPAIKAYRTPVATNLVAA